MRHPNRKSERRECHLCGVALTKDDAGMKCRPRRCMDCLGRSRFREWESNSDWIEAAHYIEQRRSDYYYHGRCLPHDS